MSNEHVRLRLVGLVGFFLVLVLVVSTATAQSSPDAGRLFNRPRVPLPDLEEESARSKEAAPLGLPVPSEAPSRSPFAETEGVTLRGFHIIGSTVFSQAELATVVAPFLNRPLYSEDLAGLTDALTELYIDRGYVSSGAVVPDQSLEDQILRIQIFEGRLEQLEIVGDADLPRRWIESRLRDAFTSPLDVSALERGLRRLQRDERIARVDAVLVPGTGRGDSRLQLDLSPANPLQMELSVANDVAPALGGARAGVRLVHRNLLGLGDQVRVAVAGAEGLFDFEASYQIPITPWLTELNLFGDLGRGEVVAGDFKAFNFRSEVERYGLELIQPVYRSLASDVTFRVGFERRRSQVEFFGASDFQLETAAEEKGRVSLSLLRTELEWTHRTARQIFAARVRGTFGLDLWEATTPNRTRDSLSAATLPDGNFQAGLLQLQYARRVDTPLGGGELILRSDLQLASGSLFSLEALSAGGVSTVRGYPENQLLADNGVLGSIEFRLPILPPQMRPHALRVAPFLDFGSLWDDPQRGIDRFERTLVSVGLGLNYRFAERFECTTSIGFPLKNRPGSVEGDALQDVGIHLSARVLVF